VTSTANAQLDYTVRSQARVIRAKAIESRLVERYRLWLAKQNRKLQSVTYGSLRCDGYEAERKNLIEAKSSARTEHPRMAVGQLMHYEFRGRRKFGELNKAILVPNAPKAGNVEWLKSIGIAVIWPEKGRLEPIAAACGLECGTSGAGQDDQAAEARPATLPSIQEPGTTLHRVKQYKKGEANLPCFWSPVKQQTRRRRSQWWTGGNSAAGYPQHSRDAVSNRRCSRGY
jgi:hypothetical protein